MVKSQVFKTKPEERKSAMMHISWNCANDLDPSNNAYQVSATGTEGSHVKLEKTESATEEDEAALISTKISPRLLHYYYKKFRKPSDKSVQVISNCVHGSTQTEDLMDTTVIYPDTVEMLKIYPDYQTDNNRDRSTVTTESAFDAGKENYIEITRSLMETVKDMMHNQADLIKIQTNAINRLANAIENQTTVITNNIGQDELE